jgi:hypothetical protein
MMPTLPAPAFEPHIVMSDFKCAIGDVFATFVKGQVLRDFGTINALKNGGMPIIPASEAATAICCPKCKAVQRRSA